MASFGVYMFKRTIPTVSVRSDYGAHGILKLENMMNDDTDRAVRPKEADDFSDESHFSRIRDTLQQIDLVYRVVDLYSDHLEIAHQSQDIMRIFKSGKCVSLLGAEGLHQIGNSSSVLRMIHRLGVRYVTLAHDKNNAYVDSAVCRTISLTVLVENGEKAANA